MENVNLKNRTPAESIPFLHARGSYYGVGFRIGSTFKSMIRELLESWSFFNDELLPKFKTPEGQEIYSNSLNLCNKKFPHYVEEIKGMAEGSDIDFHKLFLLNIDSIMITGGGDTCIRSEKTIENGCTSVICHKKEIILGHTEDAVTEIVNHIYVLNAEILNDKGETVEKFTSLSYAGHLVGYTMGYNSHGTVYSVNTLFPNVYAAGTPRAFIARALLNCASLKEALDIMRDTGTGISDGFSLNLCLKDKKHPGDFEFFNIEVLPPAQNTDIKESMMNLTKVKHGESFAHCNKYLRMDATEPNFPVACSTCRHDTLNTLVETKDIDGIEDIKRVLSDQSNEEYPIFICKNTSKLFIKTVAVGIFDLKQQTYSIYTGPPATSSPLTVIKMDV